MKDTAQDCTSESHVSLNKNHLDMSFRTGSPSTTSNATSEFGDLKLYYKPHITTTVVCRTR
jgi:hypothetical protein